MSMFSSLTGIGINPFGKTKVKINPIKALGTALTVGSMGGLGPVAGALGRIPGVAAGAAKVGGVLGKIPGASKVGGFLLNGFGKAGQNVQPGGYNVNDPSQNPYANPDDPNAGSGGGGGGATPAGGWLSQLGSFLGKPGVAQAGADVLGGVLQGQSAAAQNKQQGEQFNRVQTNNEQTGALAAERQRAAAPLRDNALYMLQQRMGMNNQAFKPHDMFNEGYGSGAPQLGGLDEEELARRRAGYKPGAGGVNQALYDAYIRKYGGK